MKRPFCEYTVYIRIPYFQTRQYYIECLISEPIPMKLWLTPIHRYLYVLNIYLYMYNIYDNILHGAIFFPFLSPLIITVRPYFWWMASAPGASSESGSCPTTGFTGGYGKGSINGWIVPYLSISIRYLPLSLEGKIPLWVSIEVSRSNVYNPIWWTSGIPRGLSLSNSRHPWFELQPSRP